ncbi:TPA: hypothetical protein KOR49_003807 [Clostridioides difficile]|uniref:hypothetical protein n=1 Tax=Clostridioides difficile TaxID=1496 RepID=UPI00016C6458|nr:hypothetical protein [Clostridioides difficile]EGT3944105.1 hypothetical protein [Clostridioides difficile]MBG0197977.1 hypothetical protein [Clostridioides difficile]MCA0574648.1 hypothetical protein [Clostridioides difficile]PBG25656.1 hypothetical protein BGU81_12650 [Clostridioides difficile]SJT20619.1 Uncharacterised protein [Clostridioides difficile]
MKKIDMDQVKDYQLCLLLAEKQSNNKRFNSMNGGFDPEKGINVHRQVYLDFLRFIKIYII